MKAQEINAEAVKAIRHHRQWTQADLADFLGCSQPTVSKIENGAKCSGVVERSLQRLLAETIGNQVAA